VAGQAFILTEFDSYVDLFIKFRFVDPESTLTPVKV